MKKFIVRLFYWSLSFVFKKKFDLVLDSDYFSWGDSLTDGYENTIVILWKKRRYITVWGDEAFIYRVAFL